MSVLIKGAEKPTNCDVCFLADTNICWRACPLVEVPTPHGRLIDADKMLCDESEAFISAQVKLSKQATAESKALRQLNDVVHKKIQMLMIDTPTVIDAEAGNGEK